MSRSLFSSSFGSSGLYINISINSLQYQGKHKLHCKYGGIFSAELISRQHIENPTLCKSFSLNDSRERNQHSHRNEFSVVQYFYSGLSKVHTILRISLSLCSLTQIDVCQLYKDCFTHSSACNSRLNKMTEWSGLKLIFEDSYSFYPILERSQQPDNRCYLLQLTAGAGSGVLMKHYCEVTLFSPAKFNPTSDITYSFAGVLYPFIMKSFSRHLDNCNTKYDTVQVSGKADRFSCFVQGRNCLYHSQKVFPANIKQLIHLGIGVFKVHFFMHIHVKKPRAINVLQTQVTFMMHSMSWVDIVIKTPKSATNSSRFPFLSAYSHVIDVSQTMSLLGQFGIPFWKASLFLVLCCCKRNLQCLPSF